MKIQYLNENFSTRGLIWVKDKPSSLETIAIANTIIEDYKEQGYTLILRQLFYQFLSRGLLDDEMMTDPKTANNAYKNMGNLIRKARNNGLISWYGIEDGERSISGIRNHEEDDLECVSGLETLLSLDFWERQDYYVEVWVEKKSLGNIVARACRPFKCPHMATKGYISASAAWVAGQRFKQARNAGKEVIMIHLGDHDPEGVDMTRDNQKRLEMYSEGSVEVRRIGLTLDQVHQYNPPPNFAKESSSRYDAYVEEFGIKECWELDALEPKVLVELIKDEIKPLINWDVWNETRKTETTKRYHLEKVVDYWDSIKRLIDDLDPYTPKYCEECGQQLDEDGDCHNEECSLCWDEDHEE